MVERIEATKVRLKLSESQEEQLAPLMEEYITARFKLLEKHGIKLSAGEKREKLSFSQLRAMSKDMKQLEESNNSKVAKILDEKQMEEYKKIQTENKKAFRNKIRNR
ncbi:hypothetical protein SG34_024375 [Thalassomonas viridans]|uniref:Uncharacterized protein n=1 Tax=Thalassomonas viridans TaxID=137584 RepID=A0AAF0C874_9GAMM|nr:hypothetical protein [Thalassomonas viridans]WDE04438.1 hypothetical protein SG34_024375 [Thalassomonas viridans]